MKPERNKVQVCVKWIGNKSDRVIPQEMEIKMLSPAQQNKYLNKRHRMMVRVLSALCVASCLEELIFIPAASHSTTKIPWILSVPPTSSQGTES